MEAISMYISGGMNKEDVIQTHTHTHTHTHTIEYYSVIKMNKIVQFAEIWMDLDVTHNEVSQEEKNIIWKDICTPIFIAALFTIAKSRK